MQRHDEDEITPRLKEAKRRRAHVGAHASGNEQPLSAGSYAIVALISGLIGLALLVFYIYKVPALVESVQSRVFYILLFPWALACAAFLFGTMRSYARYKQKHLGSALELGGPVVLFFLVLWGGFRLVPQPPVFFDLTVRANSGDPIGSLITSGKVWIELGRERKADFFDEKGEANFKDVPSKFEGEIVRLLPEVEGYEKQWQQQRIDGNHVLNISLVRAKLLLKGIIKPRPRDPKRVKITVDGQGGAVMPDEFGRFDFPVEGKPGDHIRLKVHLDTEPEPIYDDYQTLPGPVTLMIDPHRSDPQ